MSALTWQRSIVEQGIAMYQPNENISKERQLRDKIERLILLFHEALKNKEWHKIHPQAVLLIELLLHFKKSNLTLFKVIVQTKFLKSYTEKLLVSLKDLNDLAKDECIKAALSHLARIYHETNLIDSTNQKQFTSLQTAFNRSKFVQHIEHDAILNMGKNDDDHIEKLLHEDNLSLDNGIKIVSDNELERAKLLLVSSLSFFTKRLFRQSTKTYENFDLLIKESNKLCQWLTVQFNSLEKHEWQILLSYYYACGSYQNDCVKPFKNINAAHELLLATVANASFDMLLNIQHLGLLLSQYNKEFSNKVQALQDIVVEKIIDYCLFIKPIIADIPEILKIDKTHFNNSRLAFND